MQNPITQEVQEESRCAIAWLPQLLIEGAKESRQTGAAVESFRNAMVQGNGRSRSGQSVDRASRVNLPIDNLLGTLVAVQLEQKR